jgi:hypothetical protein
VWTVGRKGGFLTATVSDLPIQPQKVVYISKIFFWLFQRQDLGFSSTIRPFWLSFTIQIQFSGFNYSKRYTLYYINRLLLFGCSFGFYYSNGFSNYYKKVYPISAPGFRLLQFGRSSLAFTIESNFGFKFTIQKRTPYIGFTYTAQKDVYISKKIFWLLLFKFFFGFHIMFFFFCGRRGGRRISNRYCLGFTYSAQKVVYIGKKFFLAYQRQDFGFIYSAFFK